MPTQVPELIPCRLTPMLVHALGPLGGIEDDLARALEAVRARGVLASQEGCPKSKSMAFHPFAGSFFEIFTMCRGKQTGVEI